MPAAVVRACESPSEDREPVKRMRAYVPGFTICVFRASLSEALALLAREPGSGSPSPEATDLMVLLEAGKLSHKRFFSVSKLDDLRGIEVDAAKT